jgi:hypothetical protein
MYLHFHSYFHPPVSFLLWFLYDWNTNTWPLSRKGGALSFVNVNIVYRNIFTYHIHEVLPLTILIRLAVRLRTPTLGPLSRKGGALNFVNVNIIYRNIIMYHTHDVLPLL